MTTTAEKISVMQAFERGEKVEFYSGGSWGKIDDPSWDWLHYEYRVAPKPIDLVKVLEVMALNVKMNLPDGCDLARVAGHAWTDIIARAKELQE